MKEFIQFVSKAGNVILLSTDVVVCIEEDENRTAIVYFEEEFEIKAVKTRTPFLMIVEKIKQSYCRVL